MKNRRANFLIISGALLILMRVGRMLMIYNEGRNVLETISNYYYISILLGLITIAVGVYTKRKVK